MALRWKFFHPLLLPLPPSLPPPSLPPFLPPSFPPPSLPPSLPPPSLPPSPPSLPQMKGLNGTSLKMWVIPNGNNNLSTPASKTAPNSQPSSIKTAYVNLMPLPGSQLERQAGEGFAATLLLENPVGQNMITYEQLLQEVSGFSTSQMMALSDFFAWYVMSVRLVYKCVKLYTVY